VSISLMDAVGPFVLLHPLPESRHGFTRFLARQTFIDDMGGVVELVAVPTGHGSARALRAFWREDAVRQVAMGGAAVGATILIGEVQDLLYRVTERTGVTSFAAQSALSSTGDPASLNVALALAAAFTDVLETIHERGAVLGSVAFDDIMISPRGQVRVRARASDETVLFPPECTPEEHRQSDAGTTGDVWLVGRVLKALLCGGTDDALLPRVPKALRPDMKELLSAMLSRQRTKRPLLSVVREQCSRIMATLEGPAVRDVLRSLTLGSPDSPGDDEPNPEVVERLRATCSEVAKPPDPFVVADASPARGLPTSEKEPGSLARKVSRERSRTREEHDARGRGPSARAPSAGPNRTVVARRRSSLSDDSPSSSVPSSDPDADGLVFDDVPSGPLHHAPAHASAAPVTEVSTSIVPMADLHTADDRGLPQTGIDPVPHAQSSFSDEGDGVARAPQVNDAKPAFTLAALGPADLDLHVDDDIALIAARVAPGLTATEPKAPTAVVDTRTAEAAAADIASVGESAASAVWATGDVDDDEPETRTDRRRGIAALPASADPAATLAFGGVRRSSSDASVFTSEPDAKRTLTDAGEPAERTVLLDASLEEGAQRTSRASPARRSKGRESRAGDTHAAPKMSVIVDEKQRDPNGADDRTALLAPEVQERVRSELGSSPWPRARAPEDEPTLMLDDPDAVRAILAAVAQKPSDAAVDKPARDGDAVAARVKRASSSHGGDTGTLTVHAPRGASVYVDGKLRGAGDVIIEGVDRFRTINVRVLLDGYRPWVAEVSCGGRRYVEVKPELVRRGPAR